ncbi:MAG: Gfo/Idh/MocA family oxidoreductase [Thermoprotei archaeon]|nr:Gfo/Idh/MocA family oxidoreductase [Thermoprotei archaeon]
MQERPLKVAIVGFGFMGQTHAAAWARIPEAQIKAVFEVPARAPQIRHMVSEYGAKVVTNYEEILEDEEVNVVDVCLPTFLHREYVVKALKAGKHVLCEKPIALHLWEAREMIDAWKSSGKKFMIAHVVRFFPEYKQAKELVDSGALGEPRIARTYRYSAFPPWSVKGWFGVQRLSGGVLVDLAIHDMDFLRWIFNDEVARVYALSPERRVVKGITAQDHGIALLKFKKGGIAYVMASWAYPKTVPFSTYFELVGTGGILQFDNRSTAPLRLGTSEQYSTIQTYPEDPYYLEIRHFADHILKDVELMVTPEDAYKALEISLAAVKSSLTGEPVSLPLKEEVIP